jgi:hypothetical protein
MNHVTIYHDPDCGTPRNTPAMIRNAGVEPTVIEYLKNPPDRVLAHPILTTRLVVVTSQDHRVTAAS